MGVRPVDLQAPLPQADEVSRVQRVPQAASERQASAAVVQGEPEVRVRQEDVVGSPDVAAEEAESDRRRRHERQAPRQSKTRSPDSEAEAEEPAPPPAKGARVDFRGL
jgi:hypothetical protein